jgi:hypothetical protein
MCVPAAPATLRGLASQHDRRSLITTSEICQTRVLVVQAILACPGTLHGSGQPARQMARFSNSTIASTTCVGTCGRWRKEGRRISTSGVEGTVNRLIGRRLGKGQHMCWTKRGAHLLLRDARRDRQPDTTGTHGVRGGSRGGGVVPAERHGKLRDGSRVVRGRRHGTGVMGAGMPRPPRRRIPQASFC